MHSGVETEICKELSIIRYHKQYARNSDIGTKTNTRYPRAEIIRLLQNKTRHITTEFE